ncbi:MAG: HAD-IB family phosphatase [Ruminococcus sp.]|nr:HAD-IB family phosphatase [Ruminococcus sp.]
MNVYDFDNTIYRGDSTADFYIFCLKRHKRILLLAPSLLGAVTKFYIFKRGTKTDMKEKMYRFLRYSNAERDVEEFWDSHIKNIKTFYLERQREDDLIISASPYFLLGPICERLGIKRLIASDVDPVTGKYTGINCHGEEKVRLFRERYREEIDEFYSDSQSDAPLAKIAGKAFLVKGNEISEWNTGLTQ